MDGKDKLNQLKRDLYSYGYYQKCIEEVTVQLQNLALKLDSYSDVKGINYEQVNKQRDPYYSSIAMLIYEEEGLQIAKRKYEKKCKELGIGKFFSLLSEEQQDIIEYHFFKNKSHDYIAVNGGYGCRETITYKINKILKIILDATCG